MPIIKPLKAGAIIQIGVVKVKPYVLNWFNVAPNKPTMAPSSGPYSNDVNTMAKELSPIFKFPTLKERKVKTT